MDQRNARQSKGFTLLTWHKTGVEFTCTYAMNSLHFRMDTALGADLVDGDIAGLLAEDDPCRRRQMGWF